MRFAMPKFDLGEFVVCLIVAAIFVVIHLAIGQGLSATTGMSEDWGFLLSMLVIVPGCLDLPLLVLFVCGIGFAFFVSNARVKGAESEKSQQESELERQGAAAYYEAFPTQGEIDTRFMRD